VALGTGVAVRVGDDVAVGSTGVALTVAVAVRVGEEVTVGGTGVRVGVDDGVAVDPPVAVNVGKGVTSPTATKKTAVLARSPLVEPLPFTLLPAPYKM